MGLIKGMAKLVAAPIVMPAKAAKGAAKGAAVVYGVHTAHNVNKASRATIQQTDMAAYQTALMAQQNAMLAQALQQQQQAALASALPRPGWYPLRERPGLECFWDGRAWAMGTERPIAQPVPAPPPQLGR